MTQPSESERFSMLYRQHRDDIYAYFRRRVDFDAAQECAAETFLTAWRRIDRVPLAEEGRLWLYGVARNVLLKRYRLIGKRRRIATAMITTSEPVASTESEVEQLLRRDELRTALASMRPADRDLVLMVAWEELPHSAIATILGCSEHAVDQRVHRALRRLRTALDQTEHARVRQLKRRQIEKGGAV